MNKTKKITHKQSKYFTIMLVPYSSSKIKSIKIPHTALYMAAVTVLTLGLVSAVLSSQNAVLSVEVGQIKNSMEETEKQNAALSKEKTELKGALEEEKQQARENVTKQKEDYENSLDYYEDKLTEFNTQIEELEKAKEEIYDKLSKVELPSSISDSLVASVSSQESPYELQLTSGRQYDKMEIIDISIEELGTRIATEVQDFQALKTNLEKISPYMDAYPSAWPVWGTVTSEVGARSNPFGGGGTEGHSGMDISVPTGTSVKATGGGVVTYSGWNGNYGYLIEVDHGYGIVTRYGHNSSLSVSVGDTVSRGDVLAKSGNTGRSTGPHVHYEVRLYNEVKNPRDYIGNTSFGR